MSRQNGTNRSAKDKQILLKIGENIRKARNELGYSQEAFADIAGFSRSYYTEIETGKRNISTLNLIKLIKALNVELEEIFGFIKSK
jgi:transcriptional regulator with XRE-family HTH domain